MHARVVERMLGFAEPEKARGLLERLFREARDVEKLLAGLEKPLALTALDHCLRQRRADARDAREQVLRSRVELDADRVHAGVDHVLERPLERRRGHVMLVLADA